MRSYCTMRYLICPIWRERFSTHRFGPEEWEIGSFGATLQLQIPCASSSCSVGPRMSAPSSPAAAASPWSRDARSEPLPTEIFTVEPQGPELDAAGLGVAIALEALMQDWHGPWVEKRAGGR